MSGSRPPVREFLRSFFSAWLFRVYRHPLQFLLLVVVLPLLAIVVATHQASVAMARDQAMRNLRMTAQVAAEAIEATLGDAALFGRMVADEPTFLEALRRRDKAQLAMLLERALPRLPEADQAVVADSEGRILARVPVGRSREAVTMLEEDGWLGAQQGGWHPYVSAVRVRDDESLEKIVDVVLPVVRQEALFGVLKLEYRVDSVKSWIQRVRVEPEGFLYVADHHSQLVVFPFQVLPGKPKVVSDWPPVAQPLLPDGFSMAFQDTRFGRQWLAGVYPIGATGWRVVSVQPLEAVLRLLYRIFLPLGLLILLLLGLVVFVSVRWAALQALNFRLLQQNAKLLKQSQQRWTLEQGKSPPRRQGGQAT
ncbi:MAG: cache domain-containing protein [Candidatus Omnitrophica bacterium]|nr:cache domain-containing protein [Candidatus Omnitrophota bacterium]